MIKKFKRWHGNLLDYQKSELLSEVIPLLILGILIVLDLLKLIPFSFYAWLGGGWIFFAFDICIFCGLIVVPITAMLDSSASHANFYMNWKIIIKN